jgi:hypothetical protein
MRQVGDKLSIFVKSIILGVAVLFSLCSCSDDGSRGQYSNPVEKRDGQVFIPIDDTAFLIPEKSWLKSYGRRSTDGQVCCFTLHATVPDVQPWSEERDEEMYWKMGGPGNKLLITINGNKAYLQEHFHEVPHSRMFSSHFVEEASDQSHQGLRRFRKTFQFDEDFIEKKRQEEGEKAAQHLSSQNGKPHTGTVYYEYIKNNRVKYFIRCRDDGGGLWKGCHLSFPWGSSLEVDIYFIRDHLDDIVGMADRVVEQLSEFEAAGSAHRASRAKNHLEVYPKY